MSLISVGKGNKTDGYLVFCSLWFGEHLIWRNLRYESEKDGGKFGRSHELSNPKMDWMRHFGLSANNFSLNS